MRLYYRFKFARRPEGILPREMLKIKFSEQGCSPRGLGVLTLLKIWGAQPLSNIKFLKMFLTFLYFTHNLQTIFVVITT